MLRRRASPPALLVVFAAAAQPPGITPVIQRYDDVSPLSRSFAVPPADLRAPSNFERVYRVSSDINLFGHGKEYFARASGGLWAVFPTSTYMVTRAGAIPDIPPGTVWLIGDPTLYGRPRPAGADPRSAATDTRVVAPLDLRIDPTRPPPRTEVPPAAPPPEERSIWNSETYRQIRVCQLLDQTLTP
jgi:hypothetical protein